ncbi:Uu.00g036630.m01.CDS01 [Anthostomella pinea]|uniref:Uu.00g036630.m01.CDS01 n=1 Tax=Anthostomella pinea TaxID=933095 RepID=A0AAI8V9G1_9PEZI|nr:Uu.00g036630.m01.CDS01 [Anthostomella pinea]
MEPFIYLTQLRVLICKECGFGCIANEVQSHLKAAGHASRTAQQQKSVAEAVQQLDGIIRSQQQLQETFAFPEPDWAANPPAGSFQGPGPAATTRKGVQGDETGLPWRTQVRCQRLFSGRAASGWFEVERPSSKQIAAAEADVGAGSSSSNIDSTGTSSDTWQLMLAAYDVKLAAEEEERRRKADGPGGIDTDSAWVREMGWARHLEGKDLVVLHDASLGPLSRAALERLRDMAAEDEQQQLTRLAESFDQEVARCTGRLMLVPHETLRWLANIDPGKPAGRPFSVKEHEEAAAQHRVRFSDAQWGRLEAVAQLLDDVANDVGAAADIEKEEEHNDDNDDKAERQARALDRLVFLFYIGSLEQKVAFDVYINPLLHFAAVLGIDRPQRAWKQAKDYTGQLAGIMWCGRLLMLEHVFKDQPEDPSEIDAKMAEQFKEEYRQWLADGSHIPFNTMIRWMLYGKGHRRKESGTARIAWEEGGQALRYLGQRITVQEFRGTAQLGTDKAETLLDGLFFGRWAEMRASINTSRIVDSMDAWEGQWRDKEMAEWTARAQDFRQALLVCTHIWGGQPGRGPEIMTMRHCNTQQLLWNVFVFDRDVLLVTDRDKNKAIRGIGRKVARFLPAHMGKMMVAYMAWVLSFEKMLYAQAGGAKGRWETAELSKQLTALMGQHIGVELTVADYRHVTIKLGRKIRGLVVRQLEVDIRTAEQDDIRGGGGPGHEDPVTSETREQQKTESIWDLQATHGSAIARQHYALDVQFPGQLQPQIIANYWEISRLWHGYLQPSGGGDQDRDNDHKSASKNKKRQAEAENGGRDEGRNGRGGKKRKVGSVRPSPRAIEREDGRDKMDNSSSNRSCETGIDDGLCTLLGIDAR